jgi:hypothetical protein
MKLNSVYQLLRMILLLETTVAESPSSEQNLIPPSHSELAGNTTLIVSIDGNVAGRMR